MAAKSYDEREKDIGDFSSDASEYLPSPDREILSATPSTSSLGGDSNCIDNIMVESHLSRSPSTISNLSVILNENVDFVASPSAIYKISTPKQNSQQTCTQMQSPVINSTSNKNANKEIEDNSRNDADGESNSTIQIEITMVDDSDSTTDGTI